MAGVNRTTGKATDLITFSRSSRGTALRKISYGSEQFSATSPDFLQNATASGFTVTATGTPARASFELSGLTVGKAYLVTASATNANLLWDDSLDLAGTVQEAISAGDNILVAANSTMHIGFKDFSATAGKEYVFSNISVKEVLFDQPDGTLTLFNHPTNIPRIEYAADGTVKGLLIEEQRTNLLTYSEDFTKWSNFNVTVTPNDTASPSGTVTAEKVEALSTSTSLPLLVTLTAATYTFSVYLKYSDSQWVRLGYISSATNAAWFDVQNGIKGTVVGSGNTSSIEDVGNGWYRCSLIIATATTSASNLFASVSDGDGDAGSTVGESFYIYGAQIEAGSFPTSYMPTSGATATRAADIASISVDNFGYNENKTGTFLLDWIAPTGRSGRALSVTPSVGTGDRFADVYGITGSRVDLYSNHTGGDLYNLTPYTDGVVNKIAFTMGENDAAACLNGGTVDTDTVTGTPPATNYINFGVWAGSYLNGHIKSIQYLPRRLSNAQLQALTA